ncbi:MAG TPA: hypothetical protein VEY30_12410, partial [Myxococcaceae bacterium]|nr:hypothetical protein [Myxococcaceae bacterium]
PLVEFGRGLVFIRADDRDVYLADQSDYTVLGRLTNDGDARHPSLSRNGRQVVYVFGSGNGSELRLVNTAGGGGPRTLLAGDANRRNLRAPSFSPDGSRIAFAFECGGGSCLGVVNADGTGFQRVTDGSPSFDSPSFYPDGTSVLAATGNNFNGFNQFARVRLDTGAASGVADTLGNEAIAVANRAVLSPDATRVAFDGITSVGSTRIFNLTLSSRAVQQVTDLGQSSASDSFPSWGGTSTLYFVSDTGGSDNVYQVSASAERESGTLQLAGGVEAWYGP